jgi:HECT-domain (ubiquitin-transferase)
MATVIRPQIEAFLDGLHDLIPKNLIAIFDHRELELMISGLPEIDCKYNYKIIVFSNIYSG